MSKKIAILATHGFEESELKSPKEHLEKQGWTVEIVSTETDSIKAWAKKEWGREYEVNKHVNQVSASDYDALVLPGGVLNPDKLRTNMEAIAFVQSFFKKQKPVAAICHGPQVLINAAVVNGRTLTSVAAISIDLKNAGARWLDEEVVIDGNLITSRTPQDLPAFNATIVKELMRIEKEAKEPA